jgi:hypothetical protein
MVEQGSLAVTAASASLTVAPQAVAPQVAGAPSVITAVPGFLTVEAQTVTVVRGPVVIQAGPGTLAVEARPLTVTVEPLEVVAVPAVITVSAGVVQQGDPPFMPVVVNVPFVPKAVVPVVFAPEEVSV